MPVECASWMTVECPAPSPIGGDGLVSDLARRANEWKWDGIACKQRHDALVRCIEAHNEGARRSE